MVLHGPEAEEILPAQEALHHHRNKGDSVTESDNPPDMDAIIRVTAECNLQTGTLKSKSVTLLITHRVHTHYQ